MFCFRPLIAFKKGCASCDFIDHYCMIFYVIWSDRLQYIEIIWHDTSCCLQGSCAELIRLCNGCWCTVCECVCENFLQVGLTLFLLHCNLTCCHGNSPFQSGCCSWEGPVIYQSRVPADCSMAHHGASLTPLCAFEVDIVLTQNAWEAILLELWQPMTAQLKDWTCWGGCVLLAEQRLAGL